MDGTMRLEKRRTSWMTGGFRTGEASSERRVRDEGVGVEERVPRPERGPLEPLFLRQPLPL